MVKQAWTVTTDRGECRVEYLCKPFVGKTILTVDGESFEVKGKPFGIGLCRRETVIVGGEQAILNVQKNGRATLICREGEVTEITR